MTREQLVWIAREEIAKAPPTTVDVHPPRYEPPEWLLNAIERAYRDGHIAGRAAGLVAGHAAAYDEGYAAGVKIESERPF